MNNFLFPTPKNTTYQILTICYLHFWLTLFLQIFTEKKLKPTSLYNHLKITLSKYINIRLSNECIKLFTKLSKITDLFEMKNEKCIITLIILLLFEIFSNINNEGPRWSNVFRYVTLTTSSIDFIKSYKLEQWRFFFFTKKCINNVCYI